METLTMMARHNRWANALTFAACTDIGASKLSDASDSYDSIIGMLNHLVQVEFAFMELAHGRTPQRTAGTDLEDLRIECADLDGAYVDYAQTLDTSTAHTRPFLVPWFGFEITPVEGVVQPLTHSHKHRADISMLLPRLGGRGIEMDFIKWLDEQRGQT